MELAETTLKGLRSSRIAAARAGDQEQYERAGVAIADIRNKAEGDSVRAIAFNQTPGRVDRGTRTISDVSIISVGEAKGHGMLVSMLSVQSAAEALLNKSLPAYITHQNAFGDRLLDEVGVFSGFYIDGDRVRARNFTAFESFEKFQPEKFERLFEIAETIPGNFGVSIVFRASLVWETDGDPIPYSGEERPESALNDMPTVLVSEIQSADFVDSPAANESLFSTLKPQREMETEETTTITAAERAIENEINETGLPVELAGDGSASAEMEARNNAEGDGAAVAEDKPAAEDKPKKRARKRKLDEAGDDAEEAEGGDPVELAFAEYQTRVQERDRMIASLSQELADARAEVARLSALMDGVEPIEDDGAAGETLAAVDRDAVKQSLINEYLEANPGASRSVAVIEVFKANKEIFNTNQNPNKN